MSSGVDPGSCRARLRGVLDAQLASADALRDALAQEQDALRDGDGSALERTGPAKQAAILRLEQLERELRELASGAGFTVPCRGMVAELRRWCDPADELSDRHARLVELFDECRDANEVNGRLLGWQQRRVGSALQALFGQRAEETLYGEDGRTSATLRSSHIAST